MKKIAGYALLALGVILGSTYEYRRTASGEADVSLPLLAFSMLAIAGGLFILFRAYGEDRD